MQCKKKKLLWNAMEIVLFDFYYITSVVFSTNIYNTNDKIPNESRLSPYLYRFTTETINIFIYLFWM